MRTNNAFYKLKGQLKMRKTSIILYEKNADNIIK